MIRAVFFDVDFTLIYPGPTFGGAGYQAFCARYGITVDPSRFAHAVSAASPALEGPEDAPYDGEVFVDYTARIIEGMGGRGEAVRECAREICREWATHHHFELYPDTQDALHSLASQNIRVGLISNSHRCLVSFQAHFDLHGLIAGAITSADHGFMKPHRSIFEAALRQVDVHPGEAVMVGDSVSHDVEGALRAGMRAVLLHRAEGSHPRERELSERGVPTIQTLVELPRALHHLGHRAGSRSSSRRTA
jgi:HAD superfamily hydrolase (TIGR01662 family)